MAPASATLNTLVTALRARSLDRTLTTALPAIDPLDPASVAPTGLSVLDCRLGGGLPRGQLSECVGPRSSGRVSLLLAMVAAATSRGELAAVIDVLDMFDPESAAAAGIDLHRLLWIRGHVVMNPGMCRDMNQRALEQAIRALTLVLQAGNFGLVAFDAGEAPSDALRRLPFTTWLRLQRMVEGRQTVCVLIGPEPMARSSAGLTVKLGIRNSESGLNLQSGLNSEIGAPNSQLPVPDSFLGPLFHGLEMEARIIRARARHRDAGVVGFSSRAPHV
ncbi:MAG: hypothetical protein GEU82_12390 [Luteitalea sp.]|nr:hypothetical protein [Luteitalea sp.]